MAGQTDGQNTGPNLAEGLLLSELADGGMVQGHVDGQAVLIARQGERVFAIDAHCTHYGAPLVEGILVEDTVRCPWHHACFSLTNGDALRAPALNPVACWKVERRGDRAYVTQKAPTATRPGRPDRPSARIVIVGAGAAGNAAAEMLRREGFSGSITMIGAEPSVPYDRPNLSKDYLAGTASEEWIPLRPPEFYSEQGIALVSGVPAASIDTAQKRVVLEDGTAHSYDGLLLATGAEAIRLELPGSELPHVHTLRTLADSRAIIARAEKARSAVVMGASFIGLEVAASLRTRNLEVHVVAPETVPLERILGVEAGTFVRRLHEQHGVAFHLGQKARAIEPSSVTLTDGTRLAADLVVTGVGVRPSLALAEKAALAVENGVLVDEYLETSTARVFAAGDMARYPDPRTGERIRVEHWVVAERQGQTAARNLLGRREPFRAVPFFWSAHYDVTIRYVGHAAHWDSVRITGSFEARRCQLEFVKDGHALAVATIGRDRESLKAEVAMEAAGPRIGRSS
jgi:NADPH-dependent 2,4-dienoyl-CoA reductase/sulfur reductase-like enzyme/nitrite reductase/ring-hydroxylating ferredoxin subunit